MDCSRAQQSQASDEVDKTTAVVEKQQHSQSKQVSKDVREGEKTGAWKCTKNHLSRIMWPDDANVAGNVHGGNILKMIEEAGCIVGTRHCNTQNGDRCLAALVRVEKTEFLSPVFIGEVTHVTAEITHTSKHSLEVQVKVMAENILTVFALQPSFYPHAWSHWSHTNHLQLNTSKTKELVVDFGRSREGPLPVQIEGEEVEVVNKYKYLGLWVGNKLDWSCNTEHLYKKAQSRLYFLRRLRSFNICRKLLRMFYQSVVAGVLFYAVVCWGSSTAKKDSSRLEKLIRRAGSVVGMKLDTLVTVGEKRTLKKLLDIMNNAGHPLHTAINNQKSLFSDRLLLPKTRTNRLKNSFVPHAIRLFNSSLEGRGRGNRKQEDKGGNN
uniref:HotDog ACOT-type domain-containing protein n=1 Tax=Astatotilapia calliptera TaxID=8154 RepID=A0AAX7SRS8_ASTCA